MDVDVRRPFPVWLLWGAAALGLALLATGALLIGPRLALARDVEALRACFLPPRPHTEAWWKALAPAVARVEARGSRALPALFAELEAGMDPDYAETLSDLIHRGVLASPAHEQDAAVCRRLSDLRISAENVASERDRKIAALRDWWSQNGNAYRRPW